MSKCIGFLWDHSKDGEVYLTGFIQDIVQDIPIKVATNNNRLNDGQAHYVILRRDQQNYGANKKNTDDSAKQPGSVPVPVG